MPRLRAEGLFWRDTGSDVIVLDGESSCYLAANESAGLLWKRLSAGATREELATTLREAYDVAADVAERDVAAFLDDLAARNLLAT